MESLSERREVVLQIVMMKKLPGIPDADVKVKEERLKERD
jgi:hypothetical protein